MAQPIGWRDWLMAQWRRPSPDWRILPLRPLSWLYGATAAARRGLYTMGWLRSVRAPRPVIVVGNLVAGGAGKTPTVMALVRWLQLQGRVPGVISRGHGRRSGGLCQVTGTTNASAVGDEPLLIHLRTDAPVVVGQDRAAAAQLLCAQCPNIDIIVADDGLQHLRLARDVEVLVFDDRGAGNGLLLPAGPLRQRLPVDTSPRRIVLYTSGRASTNLPGFAGHRQLSGLLLLRDWWADPSATPQPLATLAGARVMAAAGLARPEAFFDMLDGAGLHVLRLPLPDHDRLIDLPWAGLAGDVIVTEKDAVKLRPDRKHCERVWVARLDFEPEPDFYLALQRLLQ